MRAFSPVFGHCADTRVLLESLSDDVMMRLAAGWGLGRRMYGGGYAARDRAFRMSVYGVCE